MDATPLILVVGGDALAEHVCAELTATAGHRAHVVWDLDAEREEAFRLAGTSVSVVAPDSDEALVGAGVRRAVSILALSSDDGLNLRVALRARMLNGAIRVVLRQFNPLLGTKIEQNLENCTALSPAAHSAATYAGAALDPGCFFALRFPARDGPLLGFVKTPAAALGVAGSTVSEAEQRLRLRILAIGERIDPPAGAAINGDDTLITFGPVVERRPPHHHAPAPHPLSAHAFRRRPSVRGALATWHRFNPVLRLLVVCAIVFFSFSFSFFHFVLHKTLTAASFYVVETMTNVGFGDTSVTKEGAAVTAAAIVAMLGGIVFTSIFIGYVSSALTRAQWIAMQGLRRVHARGHIVICGGGKIGGAVVDLLTAAGKRVVVIEPQPDAGLVRRARERDVDLLTGDAHRDDALDLCDIPNAAAVVALTDNDAVNLEIALGARARRADVPLVVRMENDAFARAASALFGIATFSPTALTAPALAGLSRFPGTRGRVHYAGEDHTIGERSQGAAPEKPPAEVCTPLCVWRDGQLLPIRDFKEMQPYDELLFVVPLGQFRPREAACFPESSSVLQA